MGVPARRLALAFGAATIVSLSAYTASIATAHGGATGIVKERMDIMSGLGDSMKAMTNMVKKKRPFDAELVEHMATKMAAHAKRIPELFPDSEDSRHNDESDALPAVWERRDIFDQSARDLVDTSEQLAQAAATGDEAATRKEIIATAKTCKGCHTDYRKPKD